MGLQQSSSYNLKHLDNSGQHPEAFLRGLERNVSFLKCDKKCESLHSLREQSRFRVGFRATPLVALLPSQCICAVLLVISYKGKNLKQKAPWARISIISQTRPGSPEYHLPGLLGGNTPGDTGHTATRGHPRAGGHRTRGATPDPATPGWLTSPTLLTNIIFNFLAADARSDRSAGLLREK